MLIGILGGGQLGRMLALAGYPLGMRFRFLDPSPDAPAGHVGERIVGDYLDPEALDRFARGVDIVTYEFENVPVEAVERLSARVPVRPAPSALRIGQDRGLETELFAACGFALHAKQCVTTRDELETALVRVGTPCVLKTRRGGYDGKGQCVARSHADARAGFQRFAGQGLIIEQFVPFVREISLVAVRGASGEFAAYPIVQNHHEGGILRTTRAPAPSPDSALADRALRNMRALMERLDYVGVLAIELFDTGREWLANEMAPRVHNTGHWTIEGAVTSQFENHLRAIAGLPLGDTGARGHALMHNLIGGVPALGDLLRVPGAHVHLYGKEARAGRKLGHVTVVRETAAELESSALMLTQLIKPATRTAPGS